MSVRSRVFVSYSHKDTKWLKDIETHLKPLIGDVLDLWADTQIRPGAQWHDEIRAAMARATVAVLLVTPDFLASDYIAGQEMPVLLSAAQQERVRILWIAVRASAYDRTPLAAYQSANDPKRPLNSLKAAEREQVLVEIAKKIEAAAQQKLASQQAVEQFHVPHPRNQFFTDREERLAMLRTRLESTGRAVLSGLSGIGKSQTAIEYAYRFRDSYRSVFWTGAESEVALNAGYASIASAAGLPEKDAAEQKLMREAVKRWLEQERDWLLILDNADKLKLIASCLPVSQNGKPLQGHILITSQRSVFTDLAITSPVELEDLDPQDALDFLARRTGRTLAAGSERRAAQELADALGYLPLALELAAAHIAERQASFEDYLKSYRRNRAKRLGNIIATAWALNFEALQETPASRDVLLFSAFLSPDDIPLEVLTQGADHLGYLLKEALQGASDDPLLVHDLLEPLTRYSLVRRDVDERAYSVHRMVQAVVEDGLSPADRVLWAERAVRAVNAAFPETSFATWSQCGRLLPQALACAGLIAKHQMEFGEAGRLLAEAASYLDDRAEYARGESLFLQALAIQEQALGPDDLVTAESVNNLAVLYMNQGRYEESEPLYRRALKIREERLGDSHREVATTLGNLAILLRQTGAYDEAERSCLRALKITEDADGPCHASTATCLNNLAALYYTQLQYAEAEPLLRRALEIDREVLGARDPGLATDLSNLAAVLTALDRGEEAEPLYIEALSIREESQGPDHADTAALLRNLARFRERQGRLNEAEALYQRALAIREKLLPDHPSLGETRQEYEALRDRNRLSAARE
jgi:tetratricopeptide (TPR) repeat protein